MKSRHYRVFLVALALFFICAPELNAQCAMCKEAAEASLRNDPNSMARSLNKGILYLMAVPYLMIAFIFRKQLYLVWKKVSGRWQRKTS